jgi:hypothetical protein
MVLLLLNFISSIIAYDAPFSRASFANLLPLKFRPLNEKYKLSF